MRNSKELPESLVGKEKMIFGNVEAIYDFHKESVINHSHMTDGHMTDHIIYCNFSIFKSLLETNKDSLENIASCFLEMVNYCHYCHCHCHCYYYYYYYYL